MTSTTTRTLRLLAPLMALGLALSACGSSTDDQTTSSSGDHNDQDVAFATDMIPHHAQAVQMSELAADRAGSQEVKDLAEEISAAQGPEIEQMSSWLEAWGEDVPDTGDMDDMGGMDHGDMDHGDTEDMGDMPGMMTSEEMDDLEAASGASFDEMFLMMMIAHHEGAIEMAQTEQAEGENPDALALAEEIEQAQTDEIALMEDLLAAG